MLYAERVPNRCGNYRARLGLTTLRIGVVEPHSKPPKRSGNVVEPHIKVALRVGPIICDDVGAGATQEGYRHFAQREMQIFDSPAVAAHVKRIEIIDIYALAPVIPFARPEFGVRLTFEQIASP